MATKTATSDSQAAPLAEQIAMSRPSVPESAQKGLDKKHKTRSWGSTPDPFINVDLRATTSDALLLVRVRLTFAEHKLTRSRPSSSASTSRDGRNPRTPGSILALRHSRSTAGSPLLSWDARCVHIDVADAAQTTAVYWIYGLLYAILDLTEKPAFLFKYKLQPNARVTWQARDTGARSAVMG
jgi:hypothetical protein